jgi:hypothetical protein
VQILNIEQTNLIDEQINPARGGQALTIHRQSVLSYKEKREKSISREVGTKSVGL